MQTSISRSNPHFAIALGGLVDGDPGIRRAIARLQSQELRELAAEIALWDQVQLPHVLDTFALSQLERPHLWFDGVLPIIQLELTRRERKLRDWAFGQTNSGSHRESSEPTWRGPYKRKGTVYLPRIEAPR